MKAALYARVSDARQGEEDKASIPEQTAAIERYCKEKGYAIVDRYVDIGFSGTKKHRPEFQRMLQDAKNEKFQTIVCWKSDRLSRGMYPAAALMEVCEAEGISLEAVVEHIDMNTFSIYAVVGKIEIDNTRERVQVARKAYIRNGRTHNQPPYGYDYDFQNKCFKINPEEAAIVKWMFGSYIKGGSPREIAARLNAQGIPTKKNSTHGWYRDKVSEMLAQAYYAGEAYYNKRSVSYGKDRKRPKEEWIPMQIPAIISRDLFGKAQQRRKHNTKTASRNTRRVYLVQHLLWCEECKKKFMVVTRSTGHCYYICQGTAKYPHMFDCRRPKRIPVPKVDGIVWDAVAEVLRSPELVKEAIRTQIDELEQEEQDQQAKRDRVVKELEDLKLQEDFILTQARKHKISEEVMDNQLRAVQSEKEAYEQQLGELDGGRTLREGKGELLAQVPQIYEKVRDRLDEIDDSTRRQVVELLVSEVWINRAGNIRIKFTIPRPEGLSFACSRARPVG